MKRLLFLSLCFGTIASLSLAQPKTKTPAAKPVATTKAGNLDFLKTMVGKYPFDVKLLDNKTLKPRLMKLLGTQYTILKNMSKSGPSGPMELKENLFSADFCQAHMCDITNALLVADIKNNQLFVGIRNDGKVKIYAEDGSAAPQALVDWGK